MARGNTDQHFDVVLTVPDGNGVDVPTDGPIVWSSSDETVAVPLDVSVDGKMGKIKLVAPSQKDANGNEIAVRVTFTGDADLGAGVKSLLAMTEDIFSELGPSHMGQSIVVNLSPPIDDNPGP